MEPVGGSESDSPMNPNGDSGNGLVDDPFAEMKTIDVLDAITIRVPAIWPCAWNDKAGKWCCGGEDPEDRSIDTGTFWIEVDLVELGPDAPAPRSPQAGQVLEGMAQGIAFQQSLTGGGGDAPAMRVTPGGNVITYSERFNDGGGELWQFRWHMLSLIDQAIAVAHYSLILTEETMHRPAWKRLVETMDREIRAAAIRRSPGAVA